jgi:hypothetical protein
VKRRLILFCVVALPWWLACSEDDAAPLFFEIDYQVRCGGCDPVTMDDEPRSVRALDGERGFSVECEAALQNGDRILSLSAMHAGSGASNYGIAIEGLNLEADDPGESCVVTVTEGNNTYEGACSPGGPGDTGPCQVELDIDGALVSGSVLCDQIGNRGNNTLTRDIVAPATADPAEFEIEGCSGLE